MVKPSKKVKPLSSRWVFKMKTDKDGNETKYKARLVVKSFLQKAGVDSPETFAPVARLPAIRLLLSLTLHFGFKIYHLEVATDLFE